MGTELLQTKLYIPRLRPDYIARPALVARLNEGLDRRLTVVSAPAGFGKTTLLSEFARQCNRPVAWVSLDSAEDDLARFLTYIVAALSGCHPALENVLQMAGGRPPDEALLTSLINQLADLSEPVVLMLDDYHEITSPTVHNALAFLIEHMPPQMHLVIAGRADPQLPMARLRGQGQLNELRQADLCFSHPEAARFFTKVAGLALDKDDIDLLSDRTEGWVAGLQMAAVSLQDRPDPRGFIQGFGGGNRYILDYLIEEVLQRQPPEIQDFLLQTSILERLCGPLCDTICQFPYRDSKLPQGLSGAQSILQYLEQENLFIIPLDDRREWYRYHRLFRDLLRQRLEQTDPRLVPDLHRKAADWLETNDLAEFAIAHTFQTGAYERSVTLIKRCFETYLKRGEYDTVLRWLNTLPDEALLDEPLLLVLHAGLMIFDERSLHRLEERLQVVEKYNKQGEIEGQLAALRAVIASFVGDGDAGVRYSQRALALLPEQDFFFRGLVTRTLGSLHMMRGEIEEALDAFHQDAQRSERAKNILALVVDLRRMGDLRAYQGRLFEAEKLYRRALEYGVGADGSPLPISGRAMIGLGRLHFEWNHLDQALDWLERGIQLASAGRAMWAFGGRLTLARLRQALGDQEAARLIIEKALVEAREYDLTEIDDLIAMINQARFWLQQGEVESAVRWAAERGFAQQIESGLLERLPDEPAAMFYLEELELTVYARVLIAHGDSDHAIGVLQSLLALSEGSQRDGSRIEIFILLALAYQELGDADTALEFLQEALILAEPSNYVRLFVDGGQPMAKLLYQANRREICPAYTSRLLAALDEAAPTTPAPITEKAQDGDQGIIEPLSKRELEVLALIAMGLSNRELAERLVLSLPTIKWHTSNIYTKLGVKNRTQAVARARALGILSVET